MTQSKNSNISFSSLLSASEDVADKDEAADQHSSSESESERDSYHSDGLFLKYSERDQNGEGDGDPALEYDLDPEQLLHLLLGLLSHQGQWADIEAMAADVLNQGVDIEEIFGVGKSLADVKSQGKAVLELLRAQHIHHRTKSSHDHNPIYPGR